MRRPCKFVALVGAIAASMATTSCGKQDHTHQGNPSTVWHGPLVLYQLATTINPTSKDATSASKATPVSATVKELTLQDYWNQNGDTEKGYIDTCLRSQGASPVGTMVVYELDLDWKGHDDSDRKADAVIVITGSNQFVLYKSPGGSGQCQGSAS